MSARTRARVWPAPILLGVTAAFGLISALLCDGVGDYLAWFALAIPVAVVLWYAPPRRKRGRQMSAAREQEPIEEWIDEPADRAGFGR